MNQNDWITTLKEYNPFGIEVNLLCPNKIYDMALNGHDFPWPYIGHACNHRHWKCEAVRILKDDFLGYDREDCKQSMARIHLLLLAMEQNMPRDKDGRCERSVCETFTKKYKALHEKFTKDGKTLVEIESMKCPTGIESIDQIKETLRTLSKSILHIESDRITLESKDPKDYSSEDNLIRNNEIKELLDQGQKLNREYFDKLKTLHNILIEMGMKDLIIYPTHLTFDVNTELEIAEDEMYIWVREGNKMSLRKRKISL